MISRFYLSYLVILLIVLVQLTIFSFIVRTTSKHCFPIQTLAICKSSQGTQGRYIPPNDRVNVCAWVIHPFLDKEGSQLADFPIQTLKIYKINYSLLWQWSCIGAWWRYHIDILFLRQSSSNARGYNGDGVFALSFVKKRDVFVNFVVQTYMLVTILGKGHKIGIPHYHNMALHKCMMEHHTKTFLLCHSRFESWIRLG